MALILGIDQSYTSSGLVITDDDSGAMVYFERFKTDPTHDTYARALAVAQQVCGVVATYNPMIMNLEGLAFGIRGNATRDLAGLLFTIVNIVLSKYPDLKYNILPPTAVKKRATGSGKAKKKEMIDALPSGVKQAFTDKNFKLTTGLADLADAYWISVCADK